MIYDTVRSKWLQAITRIFLNGIFLQDQDNIPINYIYLEPKYTLTMKINLNLSSFPSD